MATMDEFDWGGYQALRFVLQHALYVRDDRWISTMLEQVDLHLQTHEGQWADAGDKKIPWNIPTNDERFVDSAVEAVLSWLGCGAGFRAWLVEEMNAYNGHLMDAHEEQVMRNEREWLAINDDEVVS